MSPLRKRLAEIEGQRAFRDWQEVHRQFEGYSQDDLQFFAVYGYFPESLEGQLPRQQEFTVIGIRTVIAAERVEASGLAQTGNAEILRQRLEDSLEILDL